MFKRKTQSGFTLVEVMLVIVFMTILLTITMGNFFGVRNKYAVTTAVEKIVFDLRLAFENARGQKDGTAWGVRLNNDAAGQFFEIFSGDSYAGGVKSSYTILPADLKFTSPSSGTNLDVIFAKLTGLPASQASITIESRNTTVAKTITVNANGTILY
jgi:prepilin-type N-terminal cleavage/methylation domain-containing protein